MQWYKCILSNDQIVSGEHYNLQKAFKELFIALSAPKDMALFGDRKLSEKDHEFYFSPASYDYAEALISKYRGEPCEKPDSDSVVLLIAHDGTTPDSV